MADLAAVRSAFVDPKDFWSSPLYRALCPVVADDPYLLWLAAHARAGQVATFAFFGAVHALLLGGVEHELADWYVSLRGPAARPPDAATGAALTDFAHRHETDLRAILARRLVQTNHARRAVGLRLALAAIAPVIGDRPAHLLEIGTSAGLVLRHDRYGYRLGDRSFGIDRSPVQLVTEWRSRAPVPDLDVLPRLASTTGADLEPLDPTAPDDRRWLEALVWPEDVEKAVLLRAALDLAATTAVLVLAGDAVDTAPGWAAALPAGDARIVFHCATRMHVPHVDRPAFDAAIGVCGEHGPLFHVAIETEGVVITGPDGKPVHAFDVDGHLAWAAPAG